MKILKSVGCAISSDGMTYALNDDGTVDKLNTTPVQADDIGVHLDDCCIEWYDRLSFEDRHSVLKIEKEL